MINKFQLLKSLLRNKLALKIKTDLGRNSLILIRNTGFIYRSILKNCSNRSKHQTILLLCNVS